MRANWLTGIQVCSDREIRWAPEVCWDNNHHFDKDNGRRGSPIVVTPLWDGKNDLTLHYNRFTYDYQTGNTWLLDVLCSSLTKASQLRSRCDCTFVNVVIRFVKIKRTNEQKNDLDLCDSSVTVSQTQMLIQIQILFEGYMG